MAEILFHICFHLCFFIVGGIVGRIIGVICEWLCNRSRWFNFIMAILVVPMKWVVLSVVARIIKEPPPRIYEVWEFYFWEPPLPQLQLIWLDAHHFETDRVNWRQEGF